jgi:[acyl-carrier-protein] S-malonyltransferase
MESQRIGFLFPGQGAQVVGMGHSLYQRLDSVRGLFDRAADVLGYDLAEICFSGPESKLNATEYSQPALFCCAMAALEGIRSEHPDWLDRVVCAAGLSLGEYTAVCFAGGLSFENGLQLVQRRGRAMQAAADAVDSGMASVLGLDLEQLTEVCQSVRREGEVLRPANLLCPGNIAVSGHTSALSRLESAAVAAGAMKVIPLSVAGAFHTPLMEPAVAELRAALDETEVNDTRLPVYSNVDAAPHASAAEFKALLASQVVSPVLWEASVRAMIDSGVDGFIEVGTGRVLRGTLKRIDRKMAADGYGDQ